MGVTRKQNMPNFLKNIHFLHSDMHTCVCVSGDKKCSSFGKFGVICFLVTPALRFALYLIANDTIANDTTVSVLPEPRGVFIIYLWNQHNWLKSEL